MNMVSPTNSPITTLFLDVGGVLLTNGWDRRSRRQAAEIFHLDHEDMNERHHLTFDTYEMGKLSLDEYLDRVIFFQDRPFTREQFREFMFAQSQPYPDMIDLVRRIKERYRVKIAVVSNEGRELTDFRIDKFALGTFVDFFVCSAFVHVRKPDLKIFQIALDIAHVEPSQVVYIEDRPMFVEIASSLGIHGVCHRDCRSTQKELDALGLSLLE